MKKAILLLFITVSTIIGFTQTKLDSTIQQLFNKAQEQIHDSAFSEAINSYSQITTLAKSNSTPYCKATYNIGYTYVMAGNDSAAEQIFTRILSSSFNEMDKGGRGSGLMGEPYALYKHNSCEILADIEFRRNNYSKALAYIKLFDKKYPYRHFCGNEYAASRIYTAEMYSKAYLGLGDTTKAIHTLLPFVFDDLLTSNSDLVEAAARIIKVKYDKTYLVTQLNEAIDQLQSKTVGKRRNKYVIHQIVFLGVSISVSDYFLDSKLPAGYQNKPELEKIKKGAKISPFYLKITS